LDSVVKLNMASLNFNYLKYEEVVRESQHKTRSNIASKKENKILDEVN